MENAHPDFPDVDPNKLSPAEKRSFAEWVASKEGVLPTSFANAAEVDQAALNGTNQNMKGAK